MKERVDTCLSCGKALQAHEGMLMTCRKVRKLRETIRDLLGAIVVHDEDGKLNDRFDDARRVLDETA